MHLIKRFVSRPDKLLGTILVTDNIIDVTIGSITAYVIATAARGHRGLESILAVFFVTVALLTFGKILPKTIAANNAEAISLKIVYPFRLLMFVLSPIVRIATFVSNLTARWLGFKVDISASARIFTEDEIRSIITHEAPQDLSKEKRELLYNVFEIADTRIKEIMIPRTEVTAIDLNSPPQESLKIINTSGYSRIPVYRNNFDNIVGILHTKDVLATLSNNSLRETISALDLEKILRPAFFVPDLAKIETVLRQLQRLHMHMAMVVDEFGGVEGIVTLEDLMEELVGEIQDEYDLEQDILKKISPDTYVVDATMPIRDFNRELGVQIPEASLYTTVAGFLITLTGKLLQEGDKVKYENIVFEVEKVKGHKASLIKVRVAPSLTTTPL